MLRSDVHASPAGIPHGQGVVTGLNAWTKTATEASHSGHETLPRAATYGVLHHPAAWELSWAIIRGACGKDAFLEKLNNKTLRIRSRRRDFFEVHGVPLLGSALAAPHHVSLLVGYCNRPFNPCG